MEKENNSAMEVFTSKRDWTKGSITRNLLALSWPIIISDTLNLIGPTIDMIWVGNRGSLNRRNRGSRPDSHGCEPGYVGYKYRSSRNGRPFYRSWRY